jgi:flagellar assembly factor FliW
MSSATVSKNMVIRTPNFGELEVSPELIYRFEHGMLGFENLKDYIIVSDENSEPLKWLINIEHPEIGFPLIDPWLFEEAYKPGRVFDSKRHALFVVVTLGDGGDERISANLKAPVILDVTSQTGEQIILTSDKYSPKYYIPVGSPG